MYHFALARQQGKIVVGIEHGQELNAVFIAYHIQPGHQSRSGSAVLDSDSGRPFTVSTLRICCLRMQSNLRKLFQSLIVVLDLTAVIEILGNSLPIFLQQ